MFLSCEKVWEALSPPPLKTDFIVLIHDGRSVLEHCPDTYANAHALARRLFPALVGTPFVFHAAGLALAAGDLVEIRPHIWGDVRPYLGRVTIKIVERESRQVGEEDEDGPHEAVSNAQASPPPPSPDSDLATYELVEEAGRAHNDSEDSEDDDGRAHAAPRAYRIMRPIPAVYPFDSDGKERAFLPSYERKHDNDIDVPVMMSFSSLAHPQAQAQQHQPPTPARGWTAYPSAGAALAAAAAFIEDAPLPAPAGIPSESQSQSHPPRTRKRPLTCLASASAAAFAGPAVAAAAGTEAAHSNRTAAGTGKVKTERAASPAFPPQAASASYNAHPEAEAETEIGASSDRDLAREQDRLPASASRNHGHGHTHGMYCDCYDCGFSQTQAHSQTHQTQTQPEPESQDPAPGAPARAPKFVVEIGPAGARAGSEDMRAFKIRGENSAAKVLQSACRTFGLEARGHRLVLLVPRDPDASLSLDAAGNVVSSVDGEAAYHRFPCANGDSMALAGAVAGSLFWIVQCEEEEGEDE